MRITVSNTRSVQILQIWSCAIGLGDCTISRIALTRATLARRARNHALCVGLRSCTQ